MTEAVDSTHNYERIIRESPQLVALLKEMKTGLDTLTNKIQALTDKVKANNFPTSDGMSYLEAKHLLLLNYCQSLVYFLLRKAKGLSIQGHPAVRSLVEIRLFLEKIRPVDRKLQYQIQKLTKTTAPTIEKPGLTKKKTDDAPMEADLLTYRPNPDLLNTKTMPNSEDGAGVYRPPKFAPSSMEDNKTSKQERNALRKENGILRQARQSDYIRELMNDLEEKPEEINENVRSENREVVKYIEKMEERSRQEEEHFTRAPLTKDEKKSLKQLKRSRNGLLGLTENLFDEIKALPLEGSAPDELTGFDNASSGGHRKKFNKRKRKH